MATASYALENMMVMALFGGESSLCQTARPVEGTRRYIQPLKSHLLSDLLAPVWLHPLKFPPPPK